MNLLQIESTNSTPEINFDSENNVLVMKGQSYPENAYKFYEPLFLWIDHFLEQLQSGHSVRIELDLPYINTSSSKCLMMLLDKFEEANSPDNPFSLFWYCDMENESEVECAEEFVEDLTFSYEIIQRND
ncbi:DUF1987 domain-containing protein [Bacillus sp. FJAT-45350]|uniref:DUF1987 domain-containing protein n=1 Tax=Bacillus sp. FJAT-45350 TaxID=2011014 RepID=UPI000BB8963E|nr:DUF1987 domain-containing protein [Bacillus sp. FJAT-45350]